MVALEKTRFFALVFIFCFSYLANSNDENSKVPKVQKALVSEGARVYQAKSFDSPLVHVFKKDQRILITTKLYKGYAGFGFFYKTKLKNNKTGYITDIDVTPEYLTIKGRLRVNDKYKDAVIRNKTSHLEDIYLTRYIGVSLGYLNLNETWGNKSFSSFVPLGGIKLTGPGFISEQFPWTLELLINPFLPKYYKDIPLKNSQTIKEFSGFHMQSQLIFSIPLSQTIYQLVYAGTGPTLMFRNITLETSDADKSSYHLQQLRLGLVMQLGYSRRISDDYLVSLEARYHFEKTRYLSTLISFQKSF